MSNAGLWRNRQSIRGWLAYTPAASGADPDTLATAGEDDLASNRFERQQALIAELLDEASDRPQDFRQFLAQCVDLAPLETLEGSDNLALIALAQQLYDDTKTLGDTLVSIREPGTDSAMARLSTACADRPFLVDTL